MRRTAEPNPDQDEYSQCNEAYSGGQAQQLTKTLDKLRVRNGCGQADFEQEGLSGVSLGRHDTPNTASWCRRTHQSKQAADQTWDRVGLSCGPMAQTLLSRVQ